MPLDQSCQNQPASARARPAAKVGGRSRGQKRGQRESRPCGAGRGQGRSVPLSSSYNRSLSSSGDSVGGGGEDSGACPNVCHRPGLVRLPWLRCLGLGAPEFPKRLQSLRLGLGQKANPERQRSAGAGRLGQPTAGTRGAASEYRLRSTSFSARCVRA